MKEKIKELLSNPLNVFLIKGFFVLGFWTMLTEFIAVNPFFKPYWTAFNGMLLNLVVYSSYTFLTLIGYSVTVTGAIVRIGESGGVFVGPACIGIGLLYGFCALIFVYPGNPKKKLWFMPLGIAGILSLNVLRVSVLAINSLKNPENVDFNHKYVFNVLVYIFIFIMWMLWVGYIGKSPSTEPKKTG